MKKIYLILSVIVAVVVLAAASVLVFSVNSSPKNGADSMNQSGSGDKTPATPTESAYVPKDGAVQPVLPLEQQAEHVIDMTTAGFSPDTLNVKKGDSVIWTSRDRYFSHQIISTGSIKSVGVDSPELKLGESWRATFKTAGTFTYADKLNSKFTGTIVVE